MRSQFSAEPAISNRAWLGILLAAVLVVYYRTIHYPFFFDDWAGIVFNPRIQGWHQVPGYFTKHLWYHTTGDFRAEYYRPLYLGWFFLGAIAGAAAALLLTPKTGPETRELLTERGGELIKRAQEKAGATQGRASDLFDKGREYFEEQTQRLISAFEAGKSAMRDEMNQGRADH